MRCSGVLLLTALAAAGSGPAAAAGSGNPVHDRLLLLSPAEQAGTLATGIGHGCLGISAFPMGVTASGRAKGDAYWSVRCKNGKSYAVQIPPRGKRAVVVECQVLQGTGRECFKKF